MITQQDDRQVLRSGNFQEAYFKLAQNSHIFKILRDGIYSDKPLAVIREYWANARDEHAKIGKPELPVEISVPNYISPYLKIRDYGKGLSPKEVEEIYISYGTSTKTESNDYIGALGIGSKSAFCYTSAFQVTSFIDGKASVYSCYIDETEMGKIAHVTTNKTDESNGVEISVPVNSSDFYLFQEKIKQLFLFAKQKPKIKGVSNFVFPEPSIFLQGKEWLIASSDKACCVMGDISYLLNQETFSSTYASVIMSLRKEEKIRQEVLVEEGTLSKVDVDSVIKYPISLPQNIIALLKYNVVLNFNIGDLEIAASREALSYKTKTILAIYDKLLVIIKEITKNLELEINQCKTLWEAKLLWYKYYSNTGFDADVSLSSLIRNLGITELKWRGKIVKDNELLWEKIKIYPPKPIPVISPPPTTTPIINTAIVVPITTAVGAGGAIIPEPITCQVFTRNYNKRLTKDFTGTLYAKSNPTKVIINDTGISRGVITAMRALTPHESYNGEVNYLFNYTNKENLEALEKFLTDNGVLFEYLTKITIPKNVNKTTNVVSPKYSKKIFVFNDIVILRGSHDKSSDAWEVTDVDPEEEEGIYVPIKRYQPFFNDPEDSLTLANLLQIKNFIEEFENKPLVIYGVKDTICDTLSTNWTRLDKYCIDVSGKIINDVDYEQILVDYHHLETVRGNQHLLELFLGVYKHSKDYIPATAKIHEIHKPIHVVINNHEKYKKQKNLADIMQIVGKGPSDKLKPTCNITTTLENSFFKEYPMIHFSCDTYRHYYSTTEKKKYLEEAATYVKYVEENR